MAQPSSSSRSSASTSTPKPLLRTPTVAASFPPSILKTEPSTFTSGGVPLTTADYAATTSETSNAKFPRISRPVPMMRPTYDVVVIGSGYGGGVAASRMARAGKEVCVLELGKEKWPGEYPTGLLDATAEVHVSGNRGGNGDDVVDTAVGSPTGLYHLVLGEGQNAFVANGLGGTSLLNANIFLEADERTLQLGAWPAEIRNNPESLHKYYQRASDVLQPVPYPEDQPELHKLTLLKKQAELMGAGDKFRRAPQTTFFKDGLNSTGVEMKKSTLAGMDCTGVNDGSKSSVLMNYLPDAWNWGAEIFCECEVRYIKRDPSGEGWLVFYAWHGNQGGRTNFKDTFHKELMWVRSRHLVFLGAGTLGTTEILLRSRDYGLKMSTKVGTGMSGNGDILSFGYNTDEIANAIGREGGNPERPVGPTITGVIDMRDQPDVLDGYVLEEGAIPGALAPILQAMLEVLPGKVYPKEYTLHDRLRHFFSRTETRIKGPYAQGGSLDRTQTYLIMSHDNNEATLTLENGKPYLRFLGVGRSEHVKELNKVLADATSRIGGTLVNSPFFALGGEEQITVHPIGGACMSNDGTGETGATNHIGELFKGEGKEIHEGLVVVDGGVIPCALGVNPFATITALAERSVEMVAEKRGWKADYETKNGRLNLFGQPKRSIPLTPDMKKAQKAITDAAGQNGTRFSEIMDGHMYIGDDIEDFQVAADVASGSSSAARFFLSVDSYSTQNLIERSDHAAMATGTFSCGALSKDPFMVYRGDVQFFTQDNDNSDSKQLAYKLDLVGTDGQLLHFNGYKIIDSSIAFSVSTTWKATTTLYVTLTRPDGNIVGRGILNISVRNFKAEMLSFGGTGDTFTGRVGAVSKFVNWFAANTLGYFFSPFRMLEYPAVSAKGYYPKTPPSEIVKLIADDGVETQMYIWRPQGNVKGAEEKPPLLLVPGASVDHQIYALPTIPKDCVSHFLAQGYTVYVPTHRAGMLPIAKTTGYTPFDARLDVRAALVHIRKSTPRKVYIVIHCVGSIATACGLLDGTIPTSWIKGITSSQVFTNPIYGTVNAIKANLPLNKMYALAARSHWFPAWSTPGDTFVQKALDQLLRFYPVGNTSEICNSTVCHRLDLVFGRLWPHNQLNAATHENLQNFLGGISMTTLTQLMAVGRTGYVMKNDGTSLVTEENLERLRGVPILWVCGGVNVVFTPESTERSYDMFRDKFGPGDYQRTVFQDRGHLDPWMGKSAYIDVYPRVQDHIEHVTKNYPEEKVV